MRIRITLGAVGAVTLPVHYNHILQGFIYNQLESNLATWLHKEAYRNAKRTYKMFTFSRLHGEYQLNKKTKQLYFSGPISFKLASHNQEVLASFAEHLLKSPNLRLGHNEVQVTGVEVLKPPRVKPEMPTCVRMLSPITTYSTFHKPEGGKLTHYYSPHEKDWSAMLLANLTRKAQALEWQLDPDELLNDAYIKPHRVNERDKKVVKYKGFVIEAWMGVYELKLPQAFFELAYDVGLGGKNGQGFGMIEVVE